MSLAGGRYAWVQDLYGRQAVLLGAGHGFVGNVFPAVRGAALLQLTALRDGGAANWHPVITTEERVHGKLPLVQDCHGAPAR